MPIISITDVWMEHSMQTLSLIIITTYASNLFSIKWYIRVRVKMRCIWDTALLRCNLRDAGMSYCKITFYFQNRHFLFFCGSAIEFTHFFQWFREIRSLSRAVVICFEIVWHKHVIAHIMYWYRYCSKNLQITFYGSNFKFHKQYRKTWYLHLHQLWLQPETKVHVHFDSIWPQFPLCGYIC